jgi:hypothetical protein
VDVPWYLCPLALILACDSAFMGFVPAGAFVAAAIAASVGVRWSLIGPGLVLVAFAILAAARLSPAPRPSAPLASSATTASASPADSGPVTD